MEKTASNSSRKNGDLIKSDTRLAGRLAVILHDNFLYHAERNVKERRDELAFGLPTVQAVRADGAHALGMPPRCLLGCRRPLCE